LLYWGPKISSAVERLVHTRAKVAFGLFKPNRENDENPEHGGRMRGYGVVPWYLSFLADQGTYRSCQRNKEAEAERINKLEEFVHSSQERERSQEEWMQEEIKRQVQATISSLTKGGLHHHIR